MKTRVQINSIETYYEILPTLPASRRRVLDTIFLYRPQGLTAPQIAEIMDKPINTVTARINELMHEQLIRVRSKVKVNGHPRSKYVIRYDTDPMNTFPVSNKDQVLIDIERCRKMVYEVFPWEIDEFLKEIKIKIENL
jgi:predicted ArsR family transcriptional regulator